MSQVESYDVVAVDLEKNTIRFLGYDKTLANAEAIVNMAVMRRGVDQEFFAATVSGRYQNDGEKWDGGAE